MLQMRLITSILVVGICLFDVAVTQSNKFSTNNTTNSIEIEGLQRALYPVSTSRPNSYIFPNFAHPLEPIYANPNFNKPVPTNSWLTNLFFPSANNLAPVVTDPYVMRFLDSNGGGNPGLTISIPTQINGSYPATNDVPFTKVGYVISHVDTDIRMTASEWGSKFPTKKVNYWDLLCATVRLSSDTGYADYFLHRGQVFVTGKYSNLTPQIYSQYEISSITAKSANGVYTDTKFKVTYKDRSVWMIYALNGPLSLKKSDSRNLVSTKIYNGAIQVTRVISSSYESSLNTYYGAWATSSQIIVGDSGPSYGFKFNIAGVAGRNLVTYIPHHQWFTIKKLTAKELPMRVDSINGGFMKSILSNTLNFNSLALTYLDWLPDKPYPDASVKQDILDHLIFDAYDDYVLPVDFDSLHDSAKALQRIAMVALVLNKPDQTQLRHPTAAQVALERLKTLFTPFLENKQSEKLYYDERYKGLVSINQETNQFNFNGYAAYDNHHIVHGYFIVAASIIHHLDPYWRTSEIREWTETLIRDVNNPHADDTHFAEFRYFDWYYGQTWGIGLRNSAPLEGRQQESISEAANLYYGISLWGIATGNKQLTHLARLQLALMKQSTHHYYWMWNNNSNMKKELIENKVRGITSELKMDYNSKYGRYIETIHGAQQLPMTPILMDYYKRSPYVKEEWDQKINRIAPYAINPWKSVIYLNSAIIYPKDAYTVLRNLGYYDVSQSKSYSLYLAGIRLNYTAVY